MEACILEYATSWKQGTIHPLGHFITNDYPPNQAWAIMLLSVMNLVFMQHCESYYMFLCFRFSSTFAVHFSLSCCLEVQELASCALRPKNHIGSSRLNFCHSECRSFFFFLGNKIGMTNREHLFFCFLVDFCI